MLPMRLRLSEWSTFEIEPELREKIVVAAG